VVRALPSLFRALAASGLPDLETLGLPDAFRVWSARFQAFSVPWPERGIAFCQIRRAGQNTCLPDLVFNIWPRRFQVSTSLGHVFSKSQLLTGRLPLVDQIMYQKQIRNYSTKFKTALV
jgi:hypothetical protein